MDQKRLRTLRILEEIDKEVSPSQRDLSRKLGISLGLVNSFVKRFVLKGYCKVTNIPKNRVRYLLTAKGAAEKTCLTYEYIQSSIHFYRHALNKVEELFKELGQNGIRRIIYYGVGDLAEIVYFQMQEASIELVAIVDDNHCGKTFMKMKVVGSDQLSKMSFDRILVTNAMAPLRAFDEICAYGISADKIVMI